MPLKIGLFGIGLEAYWSQFEGLEERLRGYIAVVEEKLQRNNAEIVNLGLIDSPEKAFEAGHKFRQADVDIIFLYVTTYALSSTVLPVVKRAKVPVIVLNLQPEAAIDYQNFNALNDRTRMTGEWLAYCSACPVPEIASVFKRSNIPFFQVTGTLHNDPEAWNEINDWIDAAHVADVMYHNRLGIMGNYYGGMLDIYSNLTLQCATFGGHIEVIEVDELSAIRETVSAEETTEKRKEFDETFDIQADCSDFELNRAAQTAVALDKLAKKAAEISTKIP
jgi:L-arabinose isomerase